MNEQLETLKVLDVIKKVHAVSTEDGEKLFQKINGNFETTKKVHLDFEGIKLILSAFLNAAIGQLYVKYDSAFLQKNLSLSNISNEDLNTLKKVTDRAKEYFGDKNSFEKIAKRS